MTHSTPDYDARDFEERSPRVPRLTARDVLAAVGEVLGKERKARSALEAEVNALRERLERLEVERGVKPKLVVPSSTGP
jgi:hypothetical protein